MDDPFANSVAPQAGQVMYLELIHDPRTVARSSLEGYAQQPRHLLGAMPFGNALQDLALATRQEILADGLTVWDRMVIWGRSFLRCAARTRGPFSTSVLALFGISLQGLPQPLQF